MRHVHGSKALPELVDGIIKSDSVTVGKLLAEDGAYDGNDIFRCLSDDGILHRNKVRKNTKIKLKINHIFFRNFSVLAQRNDFEKWKDCFV
ncbi:MAG: hypothetical protein M3Z01_07150 [Thermoproteota archaeon]|nr:hypothetical protein [Thermoproteota archaeon]